MCMLLKQKLKEANISYTAEMDWEVISSKGITHVPVLELDDGKRLAAREALAYLKGEQA